MLGGQVHLVAWKRDLIKCAGLVAWDVALISSLYGREQKRAKEVLTVRQPREPGSVVHLDSPSAFV